MTSSGDAADDEPYSISISNNNTSDDKNGNKNESARSVSFEDTPLLMRSGSEEVNQSNRSTGSDPSAGGGYFGFSSHWLDTADSQRQESFRSERDRAVQKGVTQAAFLIRDAILGESENPAQGTYDPYLHPENRFRNLLSLIFRQIISTRILRQMLYVAAWMLGILTFIEPPRWCSDGFQGDPNMNCHVLFKMMGSPATSDNATISADEENYVEYYPNAHSLFLYQHQSKIIESICISYVTFMTICRIGRDGFSMTRYLRKGPAQTIRSLQLVSIVSIIFGLCCTQQSVLQPFARLLLLSTLTTSVQQEAKTLIKVLPEVMNILVILFIYMVFWAFLGTVLFYDTVEAESGFSSLIESLWTLWICVTTANYPDVMMPAYNKSRLTGIYFVVFMVMSFFFLMNLILASVVNTYDDVMESRKKERKVEEDTKLTEAFQLMDCENTGTIDRETVMTLFRILNKDFPEFQHISTRDAKLFFAVLDRDGSSLVSLNEFLDFGSILLLEFITASEFETLVQRRFPKLYHSARYQVS